LGQQEERSKIKKEREKHVLIVGPPRGLHGAVGRGKNWEKPFVQKTSTYEHDEGYMDVPRTCDVSRRQWPRKHDWLELLRGKGQTGYGMS
jgi:hypothetical protein